MELLEIWKVAEDHGLDLYECGRPDERRADCPFCGDDIRRHLYVNGVKNTFNCYRCGESGGVFKFIALLDGKTEVEVAQEVKKGKRTQKKFRPSHPTLGLSTHQLKLVGFEVLKSNWKTTARKNELDWMWQGWNSFLEREKKYALIGLLVGLAEGQYEKEMEAVRRRSKEIGCDLLTPALEAYSSPKPPRWAVQAVREAPWWISPDKQIPKEDLPF